MSHATLPFQKTRRVSKMDYILVSLVHSKTSSLSIEYHQWRVGFSYIEQGIVEAEMTGAAPAPAPEPAPAPAPAPASGRGRSLSLVGSVMIPSLRPVSHCGKF